MLRAQNEKTCLYKMLNKAKKLSPGKILKHKSMHSHHPCYSSGHPYHELLEEEEGTCLSKRKRHKMMRDLTKKGLVCRSKEAY